jgi:hypothetical protein
MNCSQLLERKATTNWEKPGFSPQSLEARFNEIRAESRLWAALKPSPSPSNSHEPDRAATLRPVSTPRWG